MMDTLKIVGKGALWFLIALALTMWVGIRFDLALPDDGILLATACTLLWAGKVISQRTFTRQSMARCTKRLGIAAAIAIAVLALRGSGTALSPEQAHQQRIAKAEARFMQRAIEHHTIPPDSLYVICDTRDRIIGYETFEKETVIFDGVSLNTTTETCW